MRRLIILSLLALAVPAAAPADSITDVASILRADVPEPFRYGVAQDLATNIVDAQFLASYGGPASLELSIESVVRAIGIDNTAYVGWASLDPITWLQSTIAIDPGASIGLTPTAIYFGDVAVTTPESPTWIVVIIGLVLIGAYYGWRWLRPRKPSAPVLPLTPYGPVTESARWRAAMNMKEDDELKAHVEELLSKEMGNVALGMAEARRRYPEAYEG